ncbi:MAG: SAM-dependent methyltransferase [Verrucomicrobiales bacterium]|jgi:SAM-dependent methyltransferase
MGLFSSKSKQQDASRVQELTAKLQKLREQRDKIRDTRDRLKYQLRETRENLDDLQLEHQQLWSEHFGDFYSLATPPREIVAHIAHRRDADFDDGMHMLITGYMAAQRLGKIVREELPAGGVRRVLDFGCGCARVTRFLDCLGAPGEVELFGCDIDKSAIDWCNANLGEKGTYFVNGDRPPMPAALPEFDVITVLSVFTHLPEDMQFEWLRALGAKLRKGGLMLATVHGPSFQRFVPDAQRTEYEEQGFCYTDLGKTPDLPDYYLSTFHTHEYVQKRWAQEGFRVRRILEQAVPQATVRQDVVVLEKE